MFPCWVLLPLGPTVHWFIGSLSKRKPNHSIDQRPRQRRNARNDRERCGDNAIAFIVARARSEGDDDRGGDGDDIVVPS